MGETGSFLKYYIKSSCQKRKKDDKLEFIKIKTLYR